MRKKLLLPLLASLACMAGNAETRTFTAASLNVDGMPPSLSALGYNISLNPDAKEGPGATNIGNGIARQGWEFIALSEDFNYHEELMEPIKNYYNSGTHRTEITTSNGISAVLGNPIDTDGLGFLWTKALSVSGESWTMWNTRNGLTNQGSDELIRKGFRYYMVELEPGLQVDVYTHHMDAETGEADNAARESQITQLVDYILSTNNGRPIIIMGDSNCRWTRDNLKGLLFDRINADPRFDIHDPWVELLWEAEGGYDAPQLQLGAESIMTSDPRYGTQKGEVVDKIWYINNAESTTKLTADSYRSETTFTFEGYEGGTPLSDHFPVVVTFTAEYQVPATTEFYFRNASTKEYINQGGAWGTQAVLAEYGNRISPEEADGGVYLHTTAGYMIDGFYLDGASDAKALFQLKQLENGNYTLAYGGNYLAAPAEGKTIVTVADASDAKAQWELVSLSQLKEELKAATEENPMDATFFIKGAGFNRNDGDNSAWNTTNGQYSSVVFDGINAGDDTSNFLLHGSNSSRSLFQGNTGTNWGISYAANGLPAGKYILTFQALRHGSTTRTITINDVTINDNSIDQTTNTSASNAAAEFNNGNHTITVELNISGGLEINVTSAATRNATGLFLDNFRLTYKGVDPEMLKGAERVGEALADVATLLENLDEAGRAAYNNRLIENAYAKELISADGNDEVKRTYEALAIAAKAQTTSGADMSYAINNWSFEMGWMENEDRNHPYWSSMWSGNTKAQPIGEEGSETYCSNADGDYLFYTTGDVNGPIAQDITGLPNGLYKLSAWLTAEQGTALYVFGNGTLSDPVVAAAPAAANAKGLLKAAPMAAEMQKVEVTVEVRDGKLVLGAVAAAADADPVIPVSSASELWNGNNADGTPYNAASYKADNFGLTFLCTFSFEALQAAIDDVTAKAKAAGVEVDLAEYQALVDNYGVSADGFAEIKTVYALLAEAVKAAAVTGSDLTYAIYNNSFEMAAYGLGLEGWNYIPSSDTGVFPNSNETYAVESCDGEYIFNTWWQGTPLTQTITGLPAGKYRLYAQLSSGDDASETPPYAFLTINGEHSDAIELPNDKVKVTEVYMDYELAIGEDLTIGVVGGNTDGSFTADGHWWYKADNFRLMLVDKLDIIDWKMDHDTYGTIILPYTTALPEGMKLYDVTEVAHEPFGEEGQPYYFVFLKEVETSNIMAHVPYVVMVDADAVAASKAEAEGDTDVEAFGVRFTGYVEPQAGELKTQFLVGTHETIETPDFTYPFTLTESGYAAFGSVDKCATFEAAHAGLYLPYSLDVPFIYFIQDEAIDDYTTAGIASAIAAGDALVEVYTVSGVKVAEGLSSEVMGGLSSGLYIVRNGASVAKVLVK